MECNNLKINSHLMKVAVKNLSHIERKKNIARKVIQNTNACKKRRNMAALPIGKHFDLTEFQKELLKKLQRHWSDVTR